MAWLRPRGVLGLSSGPDARAPKALPWRPHSTLNLQRGTFSHRHAVLHDQGEGREHVPLASLAEQEGAEQFVVSNSHLSEYAVLGFELG